MNHRPRAYESPALPLSYSRRMPGSEPIGRRFRPAPPTSRPGHATRQRGRACPGPTSSAAGDAASSYADRPVRRQLMSRGSSVWRSLVASTSAIRMRPQRSAKVATCSGFATNARRQQSGRPLSSCPRRTPRSGYRPVSGRVRPPIASQSHSHDPRRLPCGRCSMTRVRESLRTVRWRRVRRQDVRTVDW